MKQPLCLLAALLVCSGAGAAWELVGEGASVRHFYDPATVRKAGRIRGVDILHDMKERNRHGELSARYTAELDCDHERWRIASFTSYDDHMGSGEVIAEYAPGPGEAPREWRALPGDADFMGIFRNVCTH